MLKCVKILGKVVKIRVFMLKVQVLLCKCLIYKSNFYNLLRTKV
jgi:hypothetical protein